MQHVTIYTDGAAKGNPGPGGYGLLIQYLTPFSNEPEEVASGCGYKNTTNNRMELMAAAVALEKLIRPCDVDLYTDSQYLKNAIENNWLNNWKQNNWKNASRKPVKNQDLWQRIDTQLTRHNVRLHWVKGHAGNTGNELVDSVASNCALLPEEELCDDTGYNNVPE